MAGWSSSEESGVVDRRGRGTRDAFIEVTVIVEIPLIVGDRLTFGWQRSAAVQIERFAVFDQIRSAGVGGGTGEGGTQLDVVESELLAGFQALAQQADLQRLADEAGV